MHFTRAGHLLRDRDTGLPKDFPTWLDLGTCPMVRTKRNLDEKTGLANGQPTYEVDDSLSLEP